MVTCHSLGHVKGNNKETGIKLFYLHPLPLHGYFRWRAAAFYNDHLPVIPLCADMYPEKGRH